MAGEKPVDSQSLRPRLRYCSSKDLHDDWPWIFPDALPAFGLEMDSLAHAFRGKRVFVTGHTGFKGAWLTEWLLLLGAEVRGYSLPPPTTPALFDQLGLAARIHHQLADVCDPAAVLVAVREFQPDFVFHLAAQPLVRRSYGEPVVTYATNVMGTIHVLEALRVLAKPCAAVFITTDKCYENRNQSEAYREEDHLGGADPYSSSKAAAELAIASWRRSFFSVEQIIRGEIAPVGIASVRAGNVIGGGDWAEDRIVPDCMRRLGRHEAIVVRNPHATRPWQHVLEPLAGYLMLASRLRQALVAAEAPTREELRQLAGPFNFGPARPDERTVRELVDEVLRHWPGSWMPADGPGGHAEAQQLHLDSTKAATVLGWRPCWNFAQAVARTTEWYRAVADDATVASGLTGRQIGEYSADPVGH